MFSKIKSTYHSLRSLLTINRELDFIKINQGLILSKINSNKKYSHLSDYEFKVFSQWGEDGIVQYLIQNIEIKNKTFDDFRYKGKEVDSNHSPLNFLNSERKPQNYNPQASPGDLSFQF